MILSFFHKGVVFDTLRAEGSALKGQSGNRLRGMNQPRVGQLALVSNYRLMNYLGFLLAQTYLNIVMKLTATLRSKSILKYDNIFN